MAELDGQATEVGDRATPLVLDRRAAQGDRPGALGLGVRDGALFLEVDQRMVDRGVAPRLRLLGDRLVHGGAVGALDAAYGAVVANPVGAVDGHQVLFASRARVREELGDRREPLLELLVDPCALGASGLVRVRDRGVAHLGGAGDQLVNLL